MNSEALPDVSACPACQRDACEGDCTRPRFIGSEEVLREPVIKPIVNTPPYLYPGCLTVEVGESNSGKTFDAIRLAALINPHGSIAYISFEGDAFGKRIRAVKEHGGSKLENFYLLRASLPLSPSVRSGVEAPSDGERQITAALVELSVALKAQGKPPIMLIVFDTVRASLAGNEDSSEDVAALLRAYRRVLAVVPGAGGLALHHTGWGQDKRERGSSAFRGGVEATFLLERPERRDSRDSEDADPSADVHLVLRSLKVRDDAPAKPLYLIRRQVLLSTGETSCVVEVDRMAEEAPVRRDPETVSAQVLREIVSGAHSSEDTIRAGVNLRKQAVHDAVNLLIETGLVEPRRKGQPFVATQAGLSEANRSHVRPPRGGTERNDGGTVPGTMGTERNDGNDSPGKRGRG
jgi:hypothetical protein